MVIIGWTFLLWSLAHMHSPLTMSMMPMKSAWTLSEAAAVWLMWAIMMAAMMLPSATPMIVTHQSLAEREDGKTSVTSLLFIGAYVFAWSAFSAAAAAIQWLFQYLAVMSRMLVITDGWLAAALLMLAGVYQFTPLKDACLAKCRTPMGFLLTDWRPGKMGAFRMGLKHGTYCIGCCWALMAVLFVFGVMNLAAIVVLTTGVAAEKLLPNPKVVSSCLGAILICWGLLLPLL